MATKNQGSIYTGALGKNPAKTISDKQFKSLLKTAETEFKAGKIEPVHGSLSTRTHMESNLRKRGGDILRMGDLDISPKYSSKLGATGFEKEASRIIQKAGSAFPKNKGEKLEIVDKIGQSRSLLFTPKDSTKQVKIFEVLVKDKQSSAGRIKSEPNFIMGEKIPTNTVMVVGTKLETSSLRYQGLTNLKTKTAFQEYKPSGYSLSPRIIGKDIVSVKDTMTKAMVYVGEGREKDIVRSYYITLQTSQNQARAGMTKAAAESAREAQEMKNLYPHLKFEQGFTERVKIDFDIGVGTSSAKSKIVESTIPRIMIPQSVSTEPNIESTVSQKTDLIQSPSRSKLFVKSDRSKLLVKSDRSRLFQKTNTVSKSFSPSVKIQSPSVKIQSPSVKIQSPSVKIQSPSVKIQSPSMKIQSPSMKIQSPPSMKIQSPPLSPNITTKKVYPPITPTQKAAVLLPDFKRGYPFKERTKNYPKKDFLGNTRLDNIEGLFRRNTIIVGDKKVSKQLGKDKQYGKKKDKVDKQSGKMLTLFVGKKGKQKL